MTDTTAMSPVAIAPATDEWPAADKLQQLSLDALIRCGVDSSDLIGDQRSTTPITGSPLHSYSSAREADFEVAVGRATEAFATWRSTPAPARGALLKRLGQLLEEHREDLAELITLEVGKVPAEARGEIHEMIEMCELALGLSRRLDGRTMPSQRPGFRLMETWHPLGIAAVISPFSFPAAAWSWSAPIALVCGNPVIWKPSEQAPLTALAIARLLAQAAADTGAPPFVGQVLLGGPESGRRLVTDERIALVNASGTTTTGRWIGAQVASRFGRSLLHLSGNNASVIAPSADLDLAVDGIVAAATSAAGQRCTTMRRLIVQRGLADEIVTRLEAAYERLTVGNPQVAGTNVGPLINRIAFERMEDALSEAAQQGGQLLFGGDRRLDEVAPDAYFVQPAVVRMPEQSAIVRRETVAPVLYVLEYDRLEDAIQLNNAVPQGFSSSIYTTDQGEAERFLSAAGADTGIVNVNLHTSGAEVGAAFGGEKETGGGRQCGSDTWRAYMRRVTAAIS